MAAKIPAENSGLKMEKAQVDLLKDFAQHCLANPDIIHTPELAFYKHYMESFGATIPPPKVAKPKSQEHKTESTEEAKVPERQFEDEPMESDDADSIPALEDEANDADLDAWDESDDPDDNLLLGAVKCLFCETVLNSAQEVFTHCCSSHSFHVTAFCGKWAMDCIAYIQFINYVRKQHPTVEALMNLHPGKSSAPWADESFMIPADAEDLLLQFDMESEDCSVIGMSAMGDGQSQISSQEAGVDQSNDTVVIKANELQNLLTRLNEAETKAFAFASESERAVKEIDTLRKKVRELIAADAPMSDHNQQGQTASATENSSVVPVSRLQGMSLKEDEGYFSSYDCYEIHYEMLEDKVRTESYRDFILGNPEVFQDKVVLDIGCGTGILSMLAATAGARQVIAVDQSDMIYNAMDIARENGLEHKITFLKDRMELVKLPVEKVDVIISEWMGYFLLFESMLDTVIVARMKHLAASGRVYPDKCSMWLTGFEDPSQRHKIVGFWDDVYGYKMSCMKNKILPRTVGIIPNDKIVTQPCLIKELDVNTCSVSDLDFKSVFSLTCCKEGTLHGLLGYFDIGFEAGCSKQVHFSTGPASTKTHWKQTIFLFKTPIQVIKGQILAGTIEVKKSLEDPRHLDIKLDIDGSSQCFKLD